MNRLSYFLDILHEDYTRRCEVKIKRILAGLISIFVLVAIIVGCSAGGNPVGSSEKDAEYRALIVGS